MLNLFNHYITKNNLCQTTDTILLAVSGGRDSIVMCDLFAKSGYTFAIAHCNFQLRGNESIRDAVFTEELARKYNASFYINTFNTIDFAKQQGISIEMAARDLRYNWFKEIAKKNSYTFIATAHHLNDSVETFFNNLSRGTGIAGLKGINAKQGNIIRPLLFATRLQIDEYIKQNNLNYCDDKTNDEDIYIRNYIRHNIVPAMEQLNPSFINTMKDTMCKIEQSERVIQTYISEWKNKNVIINSDSIKIPIQTLISSNHINIILFELLKEYNFNTSNIEQIEESLYAISGKKFSSLTHKLIRDRDYLIISKHENKEDTIFKILRTDFEIDEPINLKIKSESASNYKLRKQKQIAELDGNALKFPLTIRKWNQGDWFIPFGMREKKLLSDFFIDNKFTLFEKENTWLLCSGDAIVWVIGYRIDNRFRITEQSKLIYEIELI